MAPRDATANPWYGPDGMSSSQDPRFRVYGKETEWYRLHTNIWLSASAHSFIRAQGRGKERIAERTQVHERDAAGFVRHILQGIPEGDDKEMIDLVSQWMIVILGPSAVFVVGLKGRWRRWGYVIGLACQPFWFITLWQNKQWPVFVVAFLYTYSWGQGFWNHFVKPSNYLMEKTKTTESTWQNRANVL